MEQHELGCHPKKTGDKPTPAGNLKPEQAGDSSDVASILVAFTDMVAVHQRCHDEEICLLCDALLSHPQLPLLSSKSSIHHPPMLNENLSFESSTPEREQWNDNALVICLMDIEIEEQLATLRN